MTDIGGLAYCEVTFDSNGTLSSDGGLAQAVKAGDATDLFVFSHGWNNSPDSARRLYHEMFTLLAGRLGDRLDSCVAVGVLWPSLLFPEDDPTTPDTPSTGRQLAKALQPAFPHAADQLDEMGRLIDQQPQDAAQLVKFHQLASGLVTTPALALEDEGPAAAITAPTGAVLGHAAAMTKTPTVDAEGLGNPFKALWSGAREVLRTMSYYEMKNRAGVIGERGLGPLLSGLAPDGSALRVHLMGHSFGGRLVAYSLKGLPKSATGPASPVKSLLLIQAAFSHFAFADPTPCRAVPKGSLASARNRVDGPLLATFSAADRAVGWWYPNASMLAHQDSQSLSDLAYQWGGMGHDGFQQSPAGTTLKLEGTAYAFEEDGIYLLDANDVIKRNLSEFSGAHSDIVHDEVVSVALAAASLSWT
jgi:hypothetical protein